MVKDETQFYQDNHKKIIKKKVIILYIMDKKFPIGISSFEEIRAGNYYYIDKAHFIKKLCNQGKYYFLSRPRRFGKSLFLDTIRCVFENKKELFQGLFFRKQLGLEKFISHY